MDSKEKEAQIKREIAELQGMILAEKYLKKIQVQIDIETARISELQENVDAEFQDLQALESQSVQGIFQKFLGNSSDQKELEQQEYLLAVLMYKDAHKSLELLLFEKKVLSEKVSIIGDQRLMVEGLLERRELELVKSGQKQHSELFSIHRDLDAAVKYQREIFEAKGAGLRCKRLASETLKLFVRAANLREWGRQAETQDNLMEKSLVDQAIAKFQKLKVELIKFEEELNDIYSHNKTPLLRHTVQFEKFINSYYNYLINDWVIRMKLSSILNMMEALTDDIIRLLQTVEQKDKYNDEQMEAIEKRRREFLKGRMDELNG